MAPVELLLIAHAFPPTFGGVETHLWDLSQELSRRGHRVRCLVGGGPSRESFGDVEVIRRPELSVGYLVARRRGLARHEMHPRLGEEMDRVLGEALQEAEPDRIHLHNAHHFAPELAAACFRLQPEKILVNSVHDRVGEHLYPEVLDYPWAHVIFASHYLRESLQGSRPSSVLWLGIDLESFTPDGEADPRLAALERPVLFHPARLLRWKGVEVGLEAFLEIRRQLGRGSLVLCGSTRIVDDPATVTALRQELTCRAREAGADRHVHFLDFDRAGMAPAYRASDLVWYPTIDEEPLGLAPLESMACGVPLIVSDSGGMRETVVPETSGRWVPKGDAEALAEAALEVLRDRALRQTLVQGGLRRAREFDIRHYTTRLEEVYAQIGG